MKEARVLQGSLSQYGEGGGGEKERDITFLPQLFYLWGKRPKHLLNNRLGGLQRPVWMFWRKERSLALPQVKKQ
jgi:hypothetical protein